MPGFLPDYDSSVLLGQGSGPFPGEYRQYFGFLLDGYLRLCLIHSGLMILKLDSEPETVYVIKLFKWMKKMLSIDKW